MLWTSTASLTNPSNLTRACACVLVVVVYLQLEFKRDDIPSSSIIKRCIVKIIVFLVLMLMSFAVNSGANASNDLKGIWLEGAPLYLFIDDGYTDIECRGDGYIDTDTVYGDWGQHTQGNATVRCTQVYTRVPHKPRDVPFDHGVQTWLYDKSLNPLYISTDCVIYADTAIRLMRYVRMRCQ